MCGIGGVVRTDPRDAVDETDLRRMARAIRHRGPDGYGLGLDHGAGFVSTRLAIFDIPRGWQPFDSAASLLVYNGEIYNHSELRSTLIAEGESFSSHCDTEVLLRLLDRERTAALPRLNGQFAFAWWEPKPRRLTLARDRFGVRPLQYSMLPDGSLVFGSEAKAILASGELTAEPDFEGIDDVFTTWGARPPRTAFRGISQLAPGSLLVWQAGEIIEQRRWWDREEGFAADPEASRPALDDLLRDSIELRLRADVPVGSYLSGGLDSSLISALAQEVRCGDLRTFSIAFSDPRYDEREHQELTAAALGTEHHVVEAGPGEISAALPDVVRHTETPMVRTAPVPLYLLADAVRRQGITVVLTGEGADELFWGYDLLKEVAVRRLHRTDPERAGEMLAGLYPYLGSGGGRRGSAWQQFILGDAAEGDLLASHLTRARATGAIKGFYRRELAGEFEAGASLARLRSELPAGFEQLSELERAAWLEVDTLLEPYLLTSQGDRVAMAHGVEARFPFLDHRVYRRSLQLPPDQKLNGLEDKVALRRIADRVLPASIAKRAKLPYRAPEIPPFFGEDAPGWVEEVLSASALDAVGIWEPSAVAGLLRRCRSGRAQGMREAMAFVGIISTQLWHTSFVGPGAETYPPETSDPYVRIDRTTSPSRQEML